MQKKRLLMVMSAVAIVSVIAVSATYYVEVLSKADVDVDITGEGSVTGEGTYDKGSKVTLVATPDYGYYFEGWYDNGKLVSSNSRYVTTAEDSHNIKAVFEKQTYTLTYSCNYNGGSVSGFGNYTYQSTVTISTTVSDGYTFTGWTEDSKTISTSTTLHYTVVKSCVIKANYAIIHDASFVTSKSSSMAPSTVTATSVHNVEIKSRTWTMSDAITDNTLCGTSNSTIRSFGYNTTSGKAIEITQTITYSDGFTSTSTQTVVVDEKVTKSFSWKYQSNNSLTHLLAINDMSASWDLNFSFSWYYSYLSDDISRGYQTAMNSLSEYTYPDSYITSMAGSLLTYTSDMSDIERVNCVLKFVQSIPYQHDIDGKGVSEYYKYPAETLWEQKGDCEDHAILFASLMRAMGYDVVLIHCTVNSDGHMTAAVNVAGASGNYVTYNGEKYYYCESTSSVGNDTVNNVNVGYGVSGLEVIEIIDV